MRVRITRVDLSAHVAGAGWAATAQSRNTGLVSPWSARMAPPKRMPSRQTSRNSMKVIVEFCHVAAAVTAGTSTAQEATAATSQGR